MNNRDTMRNLVKLIESAETTTEAKAPDLFKAGQKAIKNIKAAEKEKKDKEKETKPTNVKETAADFFRKYSDIVKEAEEQVEEGKLDDLRDKQAAKKEDDADNYKKPFGKSDDKKGGARKVSGSSYGGSKQKDDKEEVDESISQKKESS